MIPFKMSKLSDIEVATQVAWSFIGVPYIWGGDDPIKGFDCSGLVIEILRSVDRLPRRGDWSSHTLSNMFRPIDNPQEGALAFYGTLERISHVAYCINDKFCIEAGGGNRDNQDIEDAIYKNAYVRVRGIYTREVIKISNPFDSGSV